MQCYTGEVAIIMVPWSLEDTETMKPTDIVCVEKVL